MPAKPEIRTVGGSVALSLLGHAAGLVALIWLATQLPPLRLPMKPPERAVDVVFELPRPAAPTPQPLPQPTAQATEPSPPERPPPEVVAEPKPPPPKPMPQKPVAQKPKKPPPERRPVELAPAARVQPLPDPVPALPLPPAPSYPSPQTAAVPVPRPAPVPAAIVSGSYRGMLSAWFERHKRYPESARARGEEGRVGLTFRVARSGQVLNFSITSGSGYPELDAAVQAMMRGATLPPFPADMSADDVQVTVSIRFGLAG